MTQPTEVISHSPSTGAEIGRYPNSSDETINELVARATAAAEQWRLLGFRGRKIILKSWAHYLAEHIDELSQLVALETGKPISDATLEVSIAIDHLSWAARKASKYLRDSHRAPGLLMAQMSTHVEYQALGVIGVIGPWNYPVFTPMGSIAYALAAGNAVVFKPSEYTPGVGHWLGESFNIIAPGSNIFFVATGGAQTGAALTRSLVNKIAFTGSTATGKKIAAICAQSLTPVLMECGGADPAIIDRDCNIDKAAEAVLWGAMANGGQTCVGIERIYVHQEIAAEFIEKISTLASKLVAGRDYGAATMPSQLNVIDSHIKDAARLGAEFVVGSIDSVQPPYVLPTIMINTPENSLAVSEETFGPTITIRSVANMGEAIALANASKYGLSASVWSKRQGKLIARQLQCGMVSVNSVLAFTATPSMPFGGVKQSGYGRIHGPEGLREFTYTRAIVATRFNIPLNFATFERKPWVDSFIKRLIKFLNR
jgi:acyl-CoA reductase-like NAD-dependent aldehyde dehydrogenase